MKNIKIEIKKLGEQDMAEMRELLAVFADAFNEPETYLNAQPDNQYLKELLSKDDFIAVVAQYEGSVVGGLTAYELRKYERKRSEIYIYDLAVSETTRRRGIATRMIGSLKEIADKRGAHVVFVQADQGDNPAIALYTKLGTREDVHHFDLN